MGGVLKDLGLRRTAQPTHRIMSFIKWLLLCAIKKIKLWLFLKTASALQIIIYKGEGYVPGWKVAEPVTRNIYFQPISSFDQVKHLCIQNKYMFLAKMQTHRTWENSPPQLGLFIFQCYIYTYLEIL